MTVQDDLRRLSQLDSIYLGNGQAGAVTSWFKGRLQQANDGSWIFRSISSDGTVVGFQLGPANQSWTSSESPSTGITVTISVTISITIPEPVPPPQVTVATVYLQQQLPQELTN
jgi:hypothetical protein